MAKISPQTTPAVVGWQIDGRLGSVPIFGTPKPQRERKQPRKRRRQSKKKTVPLTPEQTEAMQLVGEHKGNIAAAARAAGKSRTAMDKLYKKALAKLGKANVEKVKTHALPTDARGQQDTPDPKSKKNFLAD